MRKTMRLGGWMMLVVALVAVTAWARPKDTFEGKWKVHVTSDDVVQGVEKNYDDVLTFDGQNLVSEAMGKKGFAACPYDLDTRGFTVMTFTANAKSDKGATAKWEGTSTNDTIKGTMVFTTKDGGVVNYSYSGEKTK